MTPASSDHQELHRRVRQQLILAQVRIMELEDANDALTPQIEELKTLLQAAQKLADDKTDLADNLTQTLRKTRMEINASQSQMADLSAEQESLLTQITDLKRTLDQTIETLRLTDDTKIRLEAELKSLKSSRSWRWTKWLRHLGV